MRAKPDVQPADCRNHLDGLLAEEATILARLEDLLSREHALLVADDLDGLEKATDERQSCIATLVRLEDDRRSLCRMLGHSPDASGLEQVLRWCDQGGRLQRRWSDSAARATRCRDLNVRNGALVGARLRRVEGLLGTMSGRPAARDTYGPGTGPRSRVGHVLSAEA